MNLIEKIALPELFSVIRLPMLNVGSVGFIKLAEHFSS